MPHKQNFTADAARAATRAAIQAKEDARLERAIEDALDRIWDATQNGLWEAFVPKEYLILAALVNKGFTVPLHTPDKVVKVSWKEGS